MFAIQSKESLQSLVSARHQSDHDRLRRSAEALIRTSRCVTFLGDNETLADRAHHLGLEPYDLVCLDVRVADRLATLVCIPSRHWHRPGMMSLFFELKSECSAACQHVMLVPETFVRRQPRSETARMLLASIDIEMSATDRMNILAYMLEHGGGRLSDVAGLVRHDDPVGAVLNLVTVGALDIDLSAAIAPASEVRLAGMAA